MAVFASDLVCSGLTTGESDLVAWGNGTFEFSIGGLNGATASLVTVQDLEADGITADEVVLMNCTTPTVQKVTVSGSQRLKISLTGETGSTSVYATKRKLNV